MCRFLAICCDMPTSGRGIAMVGPGRGDLRRDGRVVAQTALPLPMYPVRVLPVYQSHSLGTGAVVPAVAVLNRLLSALCPEGARRTTVLASERLSGGRP